MGLSRNKVAVPEGAAGTPPFWRRILDNWGSFKKNGMKHWFVQTLLRLLVLTKSVFGGLAQLARAFAWHARGHRFDPDILHLSLK